MPDTASRQLKLALTFVPSGYSAPLAGVMISIVGGVGSVPNATLASVNCLQGGRWR